MSKPVGLICGSRPFAGLPTNPAEMMLEHVDGTEVGGFEIVARVSPVDLEALPDILRSHVATLRPAFVMAIGLALGAPLVRVEKVGINAADFAIADNEGNRPTGGVRFHPSGPDAHLASWDAAAVVDAIKAAGVPARLSYFAGTHLCNLSLYVLMDALMAAGNPAPCGFLHLPYLPEQILWMMAQRGDAGDSAPTTPLDLPSMSFDMQLNATRAAISSLAEQAAAID